MHGAKVPNNNNFLFTKDNSDLVVNALWLCIQETIIQFNENLSETVLCGQLGSHCVHFCICTVKNILATNISSSSLYLQYIVSSMQYCGVQGTLND